jgi:CO/xanthine dehydrogenase FAD-binding subunit
MVQLKTYHRPKSVAEALHLLARPQLNTAVVAGGTYLNPRLPEAVTEVVDLQAVGLAQVTYAADRITLGAMVRLQAIVDDGQAPALLRELAHREGPNTFRHQGTVGGTVVTANPESEFLAALLVHQAEVEIHSLAGVRRVAPADFWADVPAALQGGLITAVSVAVGGTGASEHVARTPADQPIVAAVARRDEAGQIYLALCGVASTPILINPHDLDQLKARLNPPGDFRGSSEYRRHMAITLSQRVSGSLQI